MAKEFDAVAESSPDVKPKKAGNLVLVVGEGSGEDAQRFCLDGCMEQPTRPKSRFLPGHDMRLRGKLTRAAGAGVNVEVVDNGKTQTITPAALAEEHGWTLGSPTPPKPKTAAKKSTAKSKAKTSA